ncbi:MAG: hypothetical protein J6J41_02205 [Clostridia bacterium]|nr:hypothetical protein [Clostridia bacterium]
MDINTWKGVHEHDQGRDLVLLLIQEVEDMVRDRQAAQNYDYSPAEFWEDLEKNHAERVVWLDRKLTGMLEHREGAADAE